MTTTPQTFVASGPLARLHDWVKAHSGIALFIAAGLLYALALTPTLWTGGG